MGKEQQAMLASYGRSFFASIITAFMATGGDLFALDANTAKGILAAGIASVLPVAIRYLNKQDPAFGKVADVVAQEALKKLTKKTTLKKPTKKA